MTTKKDVIFTQNYRIIGEKKKFQQSVLLIVITFIYYLKNN